MRLADHAARLNRVQRTLAFKVIASCVLVAGALGAVVYYAVSTASSGRDRFEVPLMGGPDAAAAAASQATPAPEGASEQPASGPRPPDAEEQANRQAREAGEAWARFFNDLAGANFSTGSFAVGVALILACGLAVVWLGVGLTYLGVLAVGAATALPLILWGRGWVRDAGFFIAGALTLAAAFSALIQALRALLSPAHPVTAIAKNVVAEAVRMKVSLVFIVLLIFALAAMPWLLDPATPLRYRIQTFLQYGTTFAYLLTAVLVLFLSVGSVSGEQRDKIVWQTMTKPVRAWHYVLGKWLGVLGVAAVLMTVSGTGVFLFTEYLRNQKAQGEVEPFVDQSGQKGAVSEDRLVLESQVLVARLTERPVLPADLGERVASEVGASLARAEKLYNENPRDNPRPDPDKVRNDVEKQALQSFFSIAPGASKPFTFSQLQDARTVNRPITLRYKVQAGGNMPDQMYNISFAVSGIGMWVRQVHLDQLITMPLPTVAILPNGTLTLEVFNGDYPGRRQNAETITLPPGGLEISYPVAGWQGNFARVMLVMIMKLAFLSIIAIAAATFLSFPVAALLSFGVFMAAEGAASIAKALDYYGTTDDQNNVIWYKVIIAGIAEGANSLFRWYGNLSTTESLVEGRLLAWSSVGGAALLLAAVSGGVFLVGAFIFRRRELATYSGQ